MSLISVEPSYREQVSLMKKRKKGVTVMKETNFLLDIRWTSIRGLGLHLFYNYWNLNQVHWRNLKELVREKFICSLLHQVQPLLSVSAKKCWFFSADRTVDGAAEEEKRRKIWFIFQLQELRYKSSPRKPKELVRENQIFSSMQQFVSPFWEKL